MKKVLELLNTLDKVQPVTLDHKIIKQAGINSMLNTAKNCYPNFNFYYRPGKGFASGLKKYCHNIKTDLV